MKTASTSSLLLIGSGRLARHLQFYFQQKNILFTTWNRNQNLNLLPDLVSASSHILLAISDSAIETFIQKNLKQTSAQIVHFSGALNVASAMTAHPLMSFGPDLYSIEDYEKIHFVISEARRLNELIPGLPNSFTKISKAEKPLYHALCVMGGNFPILLWTKMTEGLEKLGLPPKASKIYLEKIVENFNRQGAQALTGPLVRKDTTTIQSNLNALSGDSFQKVYSAFVEAYK